MMRKDDFSDFECDMVAVLSISETADQLRFSHTTISWVCRESSEKDKIPSKQQFPGRKCLADVRGQWNMASK